VDVRSGIITTFAGDGTHRETLDGAHADPSLALNGPRAIDFDGAGDLWLALREGNAIYRIDMKTLTVRHVAGAGRQGFTGNGGPALDATLSGPKGISAGRDGNVYFTDTESHSVRFIDTRRGTVELLAGTGRKGDGPDGDALHCAFSRPHGVFAGADGSVYVGDSENHRVRRIMAPPAPH
jgi:streptogramin lyase